MVLHVPFIVIQGSKILLFKESTWNVLLKAAEMRGDELWHKSIYYLILKVFIVYL